MQNYYTFFEKIVKHSWQNLPNCRLKNFNFLLKNEKSMIEANQNQNCQKILAVLFLLKIFAVI